MKNSITIISITTLLLLIFGAVFFFFIQDSETEQFVEGQSEEEIIQYFTKGNVFELRDYDGNLVRSKDFKREVLVISVFASWCSYCGAQLDVLDEVQTLFPEGVAVIAINRAEPLSIAMDYTTKRSGSSSILYLLDPQDHFYKSIGGYAMPETVFVDTKGSVASHRREPLSRDALISEINALLPN